MIKFLNNLVSKQLITGYKTVYYKTVKGFRFGINLYEPLYIGKKEYKSKGYSYHFLFFYIMKP